MAIDYVSSFTFQDGVAFPNTKSINASGPGAVDGTEFVKIFIDDIWGRFQAILDYAALTPTGATETPAASQHIEALVKGFGIGPGMGVNYWKEGDPASNGDRVLLLQGQGILISAYPDLTAACYVGNATNAAVGAAGGGFYKATDAGGGTPSTSGTFLILPDLRGYALRGLDAAASVDPDGAGRYIGDIQLDSMQGHHTDILIGADGAVPTANISATNYLASRTAQGASFGLGIATTGITNTVMGDNPATDGVNGTPRTDSESRMTNVSCNFGVVY